MDTIIDRTAEPDAGTWLELSRHFAAPRDLVFTAWSEARHLQRWCAPHGFDVPVSQGDFRVGGGWQATLRDPEGREHPLAGRYLEIEPGRRIVQTHAWLDETGRPGPETCIIVSFEDEAGGTRMRFRQGPFTSDASRDGHAGGWNQSFERLAAYLPEAIGADPVPPRAAD